MVALPQLTGHVAVVTGGSRGLGRAMALDLADHGAHVVVASRKLAACQEVVDQIAARGGPRAVPAACHVGTWADCERLVAMTVRELGRLDVLINNAGMSPHYPSLLELTEELVDKVLAVNLKGPLRLSVLAAEAMRATGGGSIINISSIAATQPESYDLPYAVAKAGLNTMSTGLAKALGPDVRVNTIMAGPFATDVTSAWNRDTLRRVEERVALGRIGVPDEIVAAARYFASPDSSFTTGAILKIDGGMSWAPA